MSLKNLMRINSLASNKKCLNQGCHYLRNRWWNKWFKWWQINLNRLDSNNHKLEQVSENNSYQLFKSKMELNSHLLIRSRQYLIPSTWLIKLNQDQWCSNRWQWIRQWTGEVIVHQVRGLMLFQRLIWTAKLNQ